MNKRFLSTTLALTIGFNAFSKTSVFTEQFAISAEAATSQGNEQAITAKANQLIATAKSLIGKAL